MMRALKAKLALYAGLAFGNPQRELKKLSRELQAHGLPVLVLGSAPGTQLPQGWNNASPVITVNAAQVLLPTLGITQPAFLTVMNAQMLGEDEASVEAKKRLRGQSTERLFFIERFFPWRVCMRLLRQMSYSYKKSYVMTAAQRDWVIKRVTGIDQFTNKEAEERISTGMFGVILATYLNPIEIVIGGISPKSSGHAYNDRALERRHAMMDLETLQLIARRYKNVSTISAELSEMTGLPLWQAKQKSAA